MKIVGIATGLIILAGVFLLVFDVLPKETTPNAGTAPSLPPMMMTGTPFITPPINTPTIVAASAATLKDDDEIVGVVIKGKPRAYRIDAFRGTMNHVVNDLIDEVPVSVTYCDERNCLRVFTNDGKKPLALQNGGFKDGMLLYADGKFYSQHDRQPLMETMPAFPYDAMEFERTTWAKWRKQHPMTDVYETPPPIKKD